MIQIEQVYLNSWATDSQAIIRTLTFSQRPLAGAGITFASLELTRKKLYNWFIETMKI